MNKTIYLDNAATTFPKPQSVIAAVNTAMMEMSVNAGRGSYPLAKKALVTIDECRHALLKLAGISLGYEVIFAPSATIALNQIVFGIDTTSHSNLYVTPFEHNAVLRPLHELCQLKGCKIHILPFDKDTWELDISECKSMFAANPPTAVFATLISNVTGYQLPIEIITELVHEYSGLCIVDASQALGAIDYPYYTVGADAYVFAGHKTLYGPFGIGGMLIKPNILKRPLIFGGTGSDSLNLEMPKGGWDGFEAGSHNIVAIAGLKAAIGWIEGIGVKVIRSHEDKLIKILVDAITAIPGIVVYRSDTSAITKGIVSFNMRGYLAADLANILQDEFSISTRSGYHCAALLPIFINLIDYQGCVRVGLSYFNQDDDINSLISALNQL